MFFSQNRRPSRIESGAGFFPQHALARATCTLNTSTAVPKAGSAGQCGALKDGRLASARTVSAQTGTQIHLALDRRIGGTPAPVFHAIGRRAFGDEDAT
jgi:hypothetical protein